VTDRRPLRVLHVTSTFPRHDGDHHGAFMADLMAAQMAEGLQPVVLAPHSAGLPVRDWVAGAEVHRFRYGPDRWETLGYAGGLMSSARTPPGAAALLPFLAAFVLTTRRLIRQARIDVVHAHWWLPGGLVGVAATTSGVPVVITSHGSDVELLKRRGMARLGRAVLGRAAVVGAVSEPLAKELELLGRVPVRVLRMPLPLNTEPDPAPVPSCPPIRLLAVGRLSVEKGFDVLIDAVDLLHRRGVDVQLRVIGDGPCRAELIRQSQRLPDNVVSIDPAVSPAELDAAIAACHAVVAPSRHEGLGLVALRALARGRPVIGSRVGGLTEIVSEPDDGLLVPPDDPDALAAAIERLPLPLPVAAAAARHAPSVVGAIHRAVYEDVVGRTRPGRSRS
jgi:phosphatidyl-myo-inositol dimannoside synthase